MLKSRLMRGYFRKCLVSSVFLILWFFRCQAMNPALKSRYCQGTEPWDEAIQINDTHVTWMLCYGFLSNLPRSYVNNYSFLIQIDHSYEISSIPIQYWSFLNRSIWSRSRALTPAVTLSRVDPRLISMNGYSTHPRSLELKPHHQMQFTVIPRASPFLVFMCVCMGGVTPLLWIQVAYFRSRRKGANSNLVL